MKRYLVFSGSDHYPDGGWYDFRGDADTLDEAIDLAHDPKHSGYWWHVVDTETKSQVAFSDRRG